MSNSNGTVKMKKIAMDKEVEELRVSNDALEDGERLDEHPAKELGVGRGEVLVG